jgi:hypothetical protein
MSHGKCAKKYTIKEGNRKYDEKYHNDNFYSNIPHRYKWAKKIKSIIFWIVLIFIYGLLFIELLRWLK